MAIEWKLSRYGESQSADLAPGLRLGITRPIGTKFGPTQKLRVEVFGATLKAEFDEWDDAKAAAVRVARKWLSQASETVSNS